MDTREPFAHLRHDSGTYILYPGLPVRVGRGKDNEIQLEDHNVSRSHAVFEWTGAGYALRDQDSSNGTYINGRRLGAQPVLLSHGDRIAFGMHILIYEILPVASSEDIKRSLSAPQVTGSLETAPLNPAAVEGRELSGRTSSGPRLFVSAGPDKGQEYPLWGEEITIGRASIDATWEIRLTDRAVSRPHARILRDGNRFALVDMDSANGTLLNGSPVGSNLVALVDGDAITIGETVMIFSLTAGSTPGGNRASYSSSG